MRLYKCILCNLVITGIDLDKHLCDPNHKKLAQTEKMFDRHIFMTQCIYDIDELKRPAETRLPPIDTLKKRHDDAVEDEFKCAQITERQWERVGQWLEHHGIVTDITATTVDDPDYEKLQIVDDGIFYTGNNGGTDKSYKIIKKHVDNAESALERFNEKILGDFATDDTDTDRILLQAVKNLSLTESEAEKKKREEQEITNEQERIQREYQEKLEMRQLYESLDPEQRRILDEMYAVDEVDDGDTEANIYDDGDDIDECD